MNNRTSESRPLLLVDGNIKMQKTPICDCVGVATKLYEGGRWVGWTKGRRGPDGGVCGACGGAILNARNPRSPPND